MSDGIWAARRDTLTVLLRDSKSKHPFHRGRPKGHATSPYAFRMLRVAAESGVVERDVWFHHSSKALHSHTMVTLCAADCMAYPQFKSTAWPYHGNLLFHWLQWSTVLFLAWCSVLARIHFSLFSLNCRHIIKCTVTRFPEAFRCIQPGRLWIATFLCPKVKRRYILLPDSSWKANIYCLVFLI